MSLQDKRYNQSAGCADRYGLQSFMSMVNLPSHNIFIIHLLWIWLLKLLQNTLYVYYWFILYHFFEENKNIHFDEQFLPNSKSSLYSFLLLLKAFLFSMYSLIYSAWCLYIILLLSLLLSFSRCLSSVFATPTQSTCLYHCHNNEAGECVLALNILYF
jgi:hypothetical protein